MNTLLLNLLFQPLAEANPKETTQRFPKEFVAMLEKGGWTPTPSNTARYQVGDVFDFSTNKELTKGNECFQKLPEHEEMTDIAVSRYLKGGFKIPLGLFKAKAQGKKYKRFTYANTSVQEFSQLQLDRNLKADCKAYLSDIVAQSPNPNSIQIIKAVIQSKVNEQLCTSFDSSLDIKVFGINGGKENKCEYDTEAPVTIAYQLYPVTNIRDLNDGSLVASRARDFARKAKATRLSKAKLSQPSQQPRHIWGYGYEAYLIPAKTFTMGCTSEQGFFCSKNEKPTHSVKITHPFYMMNTEVTQSMYYRIMDSRPSYFKNCGEDCPVEQVSWYDALQFANRLSREEGVEVCYDLNVDPVRWSQKQECTGWRLPTEAEWEWAARGGERNKYAGGSSLAAVSWSAGNSSGTTHATCGKSVNGYGLCDMSGNVYEWVWDKYGTYNKQDTRDPLGSFAGKKRVIRGGSWFVLDGFHRNAHRTSFSANTRLNSLGFRLVRSAPAQ